VRFAFGGAEQDYPHFLKHPNWAKRYREASKDEPDAPEAEEELLQAIEEAQPAKYGPAGIVKGGMFPF
jgi:hypothetical protein